VTKSDLLYLRHIIEVIDNIQKYTQDCNLSNFSDNNMRYDAVLRNLQTMAEATQKLSNQIKIKHSNIPWKDISGFRNILAHDYLGGIDHEIVWSVISLELPKLKEVISQEIDTHKSNS
jgi:uncharacterized protein with HEPN domain